jgi:hypothetical protein
MADTPEIHVLPGNTPYGTEGISYNVTKTKGSIPEPIRTSDGTPQIQIVGSNIASESEEAGFVLLSRATPAEIKIAYESNLDTNAFTDSERNIVNTIEERLSEEALARTLVDTYILTTISGIPLNHNEFYGLQGGTSPDEYYHLTANEKLIMEAGGPQGDQGAQGAQGTAGAQGDQGDQGAQGTAGAQGDQGDQGAQGTAGAQGDQGDQGAQGAQGTAGAQGDQGDQGAQGTAGAQGDQGDQGDDSTIPGPQGNQGFQGNQGRVGDGRTWQVITEDTSAVSGNGYLFDASTPLTLTLDANPSVGDIVAGCDFKNLATTYTLKVARNTKNIEGLAEDMTIDTNGASFELVYTGATRGWEVTYTTGGIGPQGNQGSQGDQGFQGSIGATYRAISIKLVSDTEVMTTGDGKWIYVIPPALNGLNITNVVASCTTVSSSGLPSFALYNLTDSQDILSTNVTIDENEYTSATATTAKVINTSYDDVATGDRIRIDCDAAGTGTKGVQIDIEFN